MEHSDRGLTINLHFTEAEVREMNLSRFETWYEPVEKAWKCFCRAVERGATPNDRQYNRFKKQLDRTIAEFENGCPGYRMTLRDGSKLILRYPDGKEYEHKLSQPTLRDDKRFHGGGSPVFACRVIHTKIASNRLARS